MFFFNAKKQRDKSSNDRLGRKGRTANPNKHPPLTTSPLESILMRRLKRFLITAEPKPRLTEKNKLALFVRQ